MLIYQSGEVLSSPPPPDSSALESTSTHFSIIVCHVAVHFYVRENIYSVFCYSGRVTCLQFSIKVVFVLYELEADVAGKLPVQNGGNEVPWE